MFQSAARAFVAGSRGMRSSPARVTGETPAAFYPSLHRHRAGIARRRS